MPFPLVALQTYPYDSFFMLMDAGFVFDGNICSDHSSRTELKRGKEWIMDATGQGQFNNKERTVEDVATKPSVPGVFPEVVSWWNAKNSGDPLNSGHINDQLLSVNVHENVAPFGSVDDMNRETGHDSSRSLPVSHGKMNPSFGGIEESQASPVGHSNNSMSLATGSSFLTGGYENYNHYNNILPPVLVSEHSFGSNIGDDFALPGESFMRSMLVTFNQEYGDLICQKYDKSDEHFIPFGLPKGHSSFMLQYENLDSGVYKPVMDPSYDRELGTSSLLGQENGTLLPMASTYPEANNFLIPMLENCNEEHSNLMDNYVNDNIGYGGFQERPAMNTSGGNTSSHMIVNRYQNPVQASTAPVQKDAVFSGAHPIANRAPINPRKKTLKKANQLASDYFPANVKSLLSTGIFDGVPVKYVSWSRDVSFTSFHQFSCDFALLFGFESGPTVITNRNVSGESSVELDTSVAVTSVTISG